MAARRLPSSLATHVRACSLFQSGQRCATCPEAGAEGCPLKDIEDVPAFLLERARRAVGGVGAGAPHGPQGAGKVVMQSHGRPVAGSAADLYAQQRCAHSAAARAPGAWVHVTRAPAPEPAPPPAPSAAEVKAERVSLSSKEGRRMFKDALAAGSLQPYLTLSEQMVFQADAKLRPVACLSVVLNALGHDPHRAWKPIWRWNTEEVLLKEEQGERGLARALERRGLRLDEMAEMARNNGARAQAFPACPSSPLEAAPLLGLLGRPRGQDAFRSRVVAACSAPHPQEHLVVHHLSSRGRWQFAPVAGYHAGSDSVLLLDLERAAAPRWVSMDSLWKSMCSSSAGHIGGYVAVGSMETDARTLSAVGCPRVLRSWSESRLVVEPVAEACPMGEWATLNNRGLQRRSSHKGGRHAMRLGAVSPAAAKRRSRTSTKMPSADVPSDEALALASIMLQALPRAMSMSSGGRSVHSSPAAANVEEG